MDDVSVEVLTWNQKPWHNKQTDKQTVVSCSLMERGDTCKHTHTHTLHCRFLHQVWLIDSLYRPKGCSVDTHLNTMKVQQSEHTAPPYSSHTVVYSQEFDASLSFIPVHNVCLVVGQTTHSKTSRRLQKMNYYAILLEQTRLMCSSCFLHFSLLWSSVN